MHPDGTRFISAHRRAGKGPRSRVYSRRAATCPRPRSSPPTGHDRDSPREVAMSVQPSRTADTELLTPGAVAAVLFVDPKTVTRWARAGKIDSIRTPGGHRRYRRSDVEALAARPAHDEPPSDGLAVQSPGPPRGEWDLRHLHAAVASPGPESAAAMAEAVALTLEQGAATTVQAVLRAQAELDSAVLAAHQA